MFGYNAQSQWNKTVYVLANKIICKYCLPYILKIINYHFPYAFLIIASYYS